MKIAAPRVLLLHGGAEFGARIGSTSGRNYAVQPVPDWETLIEELHTAPPSTIVVLDPYFAQATRDVTAIRSLLGEFPSVPVLAVVRVRPEHAADLLSLAEAGVADVVVIDHDDTAGALHARLQAAQARPLRVLLDGLLPPDASGRARAIVDAAAAVVAAGGSGLDFAVALCMGRRTLLRWAAGADLPPPRVPMAWMRVLLAAHLLDDRGRTVLSVAQACGYSSDSGLRRVTLNFLGQSPTELRAQCRAFSTAATGFKAVLAKVRRTNAGTAVRSRDRPTAR